ncbi:MAG: hypothetical protein OEY44_03060 [Candidatus Peregrinibacteria bacterium]|nr:hypothetical protein [Candidatus Peregrinibacteria bacterium]
MAINPETSAELAKAAEGMNHTRKALEAVKGAVKGREGLIQEVGKELKELREGFKQMTPKERLQKMGGIALMVTMAFLAKNKEDAEHFAAGQDEIREDTTYENGEAEKAYEEAKDEAEEAVKEGKKSKEEFEETFDPEADEKVHPKMSATNLHAIRYYNKKTGKIEKKPSKLAKVCIEENAIPSKYILKGSYELFKEGVGTYESFRENVMKKLVREEVKDPKERARQATVILSCCAIGRFQIVPHHWFKKLGWPTRGEEGLRAMYNFIRSTPRQINLFKGILQGHWNKYKNAGQVAVEYYSGLGSQYGSYLKKTTHAEREQHKIEKKPPFHNPQHGGHRSIHSYATRAQGLFNKYKRELPGLSNLDYAAMAMEGLETGKGIIYKMAASGKGISSYKEEAVATKERPKVAPPKGTRMLRNSQVTDNISKRAQAAYEALKEKDYGETIWDEVDGKTLAFQLRWHENKDGPGITVFEKA